MSDRSLGVTVLNMKHYVYHYGVFAHSIGILCGPSGMAELRGNDFIVSLGCGFTGTAGSQMNRQVRLCTS